MAAALHAAEREGIFFQHSQGGIFKIFTPKGGIPPTPYSQPLLVGRLRFKVGTFIFISTVVDTVWVLRLFLIIIWWAQILSTKIQGGRA